MLSCIIDNDTSVPHASESTVTKGIRRQQRALSSSCSARKTQLLTKNVHTSFMSATFFTLALRLTLFPCESSTIYLLSFCLMCR